MLILNNPVIALDLIHCGLRTSKKQQILDSLLQLPMTLQLLHVVSRLIPVALLPNSFLSSFVERSVKAITTMKDDGVQVIDG